MSVGLQSLSFLLVALGTAFVFRAWRSRSATCSAIGPGIRSFFVPAISAADVHMLAWILTGFVTASALLGLFFAPSNAGKSLDEIHAARDGTRDDEPRFTRDGVGERVRTSERDASG